MTEEEINLFSLITARSGPIDDIIQELSRFGKDIKEITDKINSHLGSCWCHKERYEENLKINSAISNSIKLKSDKIYREIDNDFEFNHLEEFLMEKEFVGGLKSYLTRRAVAKVDKKPFKIDKEFEEHFSNCKDCTPFYAKELIIATTTKKYRA